MDNLQKIITKNESQLKPVYLIHSQESFLLAEAKEKFINKFIENKVNDFNYTFLTDDVENFARKVKNKVNTFPVMGDKRYVVIQCKSYFREKHSDDNFFIKLFNNLPEKSVLVILVAGKLNNKLKIVKEIKKTGEVIGLAAPRYGDLDKWIKEEFARKEKKIDKKSVKLLENMFNNRLQQLDSEIEKIVINNIEKEEIKYQDIIKVISKDRFLEEKAIFDLGDALSERNKNKALKLMKDLLETGEMPLRIMGNIVWQITLLLKVKVLKKQGKRPKTIARIINQHPYPVKKAYQKCRNFGEEELENILDRFLEANVDIVSGKYENKEMALEMALMDSL